MVPQVHLLLIVIVVKAHDGDELVLKFHLDFSHHPKNIKVINSRFSFKNSLFLGTYSHIFKTLYLYKKSILKIHSFKWLLGQF